MTWTFISGMLSLGVNVGLMIWYAIAGRRLLRTIKNAQELDRLLAYLCVQAFAARHLPIWSAWGAAMGAIEIEIVQSRKMPEEE